MKNNKLDFEIERRERFLGEHMTANEPDEIEPPERDTRPWTYEVELSKEHDPEQFIEELSAKFDNKIGLVEMTGEGTNYIIELDVPDEIRKEFVNFCSDHAGVEYCDLFSNIHPSEYELMGKKAQKEDVDESDMHPLTYDDLEEFDSGVATDAKDFVDAGDLDEVRALGEELGVDWDAVEFTSEDLLTGMEVELEHGSMYPDTNVTDDDIEMTAMIALAHLNESSVYYSELAKIENKISS